MYSFSSESEGCPPYLLKRFQIENVQYLEALALTFDFESFNEMCPES